MSKFLNDCGACVSSSREKEIEFEEGGEWIVGTGVTGDIARINQSSFRSI